jgi:hypothetical protein
VITGGYHFISVSVMNNFRVLEVISHLTDQLTVKKKCPPLPPNSIFKPLPLHAVRVPGFNVRSTSTIFYETWCRLRITALAVILALQFQISRRQ